MDIYPHLPYKYKPEDIIYMYFIEFDDNILQCEIIEKDDTWITYIHRKTTPIDDDDGRYIVYSQTTSPKSNYRKKITKPVTDLEKRIVSFFIKDKVFYQDNEIGEIVRNYLEWCK